MTFSNPIALFRNGEGYTEGHSLGQNMFCWVEMGYSGRCLGIKVYNAAGVLLPEEKFVA